MQSDRRNLKFTCKRKKQFFPDEGEGFIVCCLCYLCLHALRPVHGIIVFETTFSTTNFDSAPFSLISQSIAEVLNCSDHKHAQTETIFDSES